MSKKLLIAIKTCHVCDYFVDPDTRDWLDAVRNKDPLGRRTAQRETFLKDLKPRYGHDLVVDYRFFFGNRLRPRFDPDRRRPLTPPVPPALPEAREDEVYLDVPDNYYHNSQKVQGICRYAEEGGYTDLLVLDDDTFIYPDRIVKSPSLGVAYAGAGAFPEQAFHPGSAFFLNRDSMNLIANARVGHWADDLWVGTVMQKNRVPMTTEKSFFTRFGKEYLISPYELPVDHKYAALHSCTPETMRILYDRIEKPVHTSHSTQAEVLDPRTSNPTRLRPVDVPLMSDLSLLPTPAIPHSVFEAVRESQEDSERKSGL